MEYIYPIIPAGSEQEVPEAILAWQPWAEACPTNRGGYIWSSAAEAEILLQTTTTTQPPSFKAIRPPCLFAMALPDCATLNVIQVPLVTFWMQNDFSWLHDFYTKVH